MSREDLEDSLESLDTEIEDNIADLAKNKAIDVRESLKSLVANVRSILTETPVEGEYLKQDDLGDLEGDDGKSAYQIWLDLGNTGTEQDFIDSLEGPPGKDIVGPQGESAYDVWLSNGNTGSEQDFLDSLEGEDGEDGEKGAGFTGGFYEPSTGTVSFTSTDGLGFTTLDLRGADGTDGNSAYESWLNEGNTGSETDFVNDLQGSKGDTGDAGINGLGFTGGVYDSGTGIVTFNSDDGIGFSTDDLRGANGLSAYSIWLANGNTGTEQNFLDSLVGENGNTILSGPRDPSTVDGLPGDFYININTDFIYGPKPETGAWPAGVKLTGEDGPTAVSTDAENSAVLGTDGLVFVPPAIDIETISAIAAGSSLGVEQALLANDGQPGFTVQAVGYTNTGKVQGCSLGAGNVVEVYANGNDFNAGNVLYREFMALGEPICFTGLTNGAIITASEGFYGFSESLSGTNESPMPLLSYGLSFKFSFFYMFRDSQVFDPGGTGTSQGWIHVVNGPLASTVSLKFGDESIVQGQENIELTPWQYYRFYSSGNVEYILDSTNPVMACVNARMGGSGPRFYDSRLVMPLSNAIFSWPRSGNVSAPYEETIAPWYNRKGTTGELNSAGTVGNGPGVSPGFPVDWDSASPVGTGASEQDYEPDGFTGQYFVGLGCAYSGADSAGLEASPAIPKAAMSQIVAQPLYIKDNGDGGNSGVAIGSYYEGTAKIYAWDFATKTLNLAYTVPLTRGLSAPVITSKEDQLIPASGLVANEDVEGAIELVGDLAAGIVIADVPITVVTQNGDSSYVEPIRSQNGTQTTSLINDDDETLSLGITPDSIRVEIREGEDGILYKRTIAAGGIETWVIA